MIAITYKLPISVAVVSYMENWPRILGDVFAAERGSVL
jgi:hypothetical protein